MHWLRYRFGLALLSVLWAADFAQAGHIDNCLAADADHDAAHTVKLCEAAEKANPTTNEQQAGIALQMADAFYALGSDAESYKAANLALELNPKALSGLVRRGWLLFQHGDYPGAYRDFTTAIDIDPNYARGHAGLGQVYYVSGQDEKATAAYAEALRLNPNYHYAAMLHAEMIAPDEGLKEYDRLLSLDRSELQSVVYRGLTGPSDKNAFYHRLLSKRAETLIALKRFDDAEKQYVAELSEFPQDVNSRDQLISLLRKLHRYEDALSQSEEQIRQSPDCTCGYANRATALFNLDRKAESFSAIDDYLLHSPDDESHAYLIATRAELLRHDNNPDKAFADALEAAQRSDHMLNTYIRRATRRHYFAAEPTGKIDEAFKLALKACMIDLGC